MGQMAPKKKDNLGFVLTSGAREIKPSLTFEGYMIYISNILKGIYEMFVKKNYFWHGTLPLFEAAKWYLCLPPLLRGFFYVNRE